MAQILFFVTLLWSLLRICTSYNGGRVQDLYFSFEDIVWACYSEHFVREKGVDHVPFLLLLHIVFDIIVMIGKKKCWFSTLFNSYN